MKYLIYNKKKASKNEINGSFLNSFNLSYSSEVDLRFL
jgi:hypothetical protein